MRGRAQLQQCTSAGRGPLRALMFEIGAVNITGRRLLRQLIQTRGRTNLAFSARADPAFKSIEEAELSSEPGTRAFVLCFSLKRSEM